VAAAQGAIGVIFYNDDKAVEEPSLRFSAKVKPCVLPVLFLKGDSYHEHLITGNPFVAHNVVGLLDTGKENVVVIGAHWTTWAGAMRDRCTAGSQAIHNGADDNASGVAVMLQLARRPGGDG
jgi:Iap family predicted aminopeptidase